MIDTHYTYALVGASNNPEKYGYKVFKDLLDKKYTIFPINPKWGTILGQKVFTHLGSLCETTTVDVAIFITPPHITLWLLDEVKKLGITKVWFQPWASDDACIAFCKAHAIEEIHDACMMLRG